MSRTSLPLSPEGCQLCADAAMAEIAIAQQMVMIDRRIVALEPGGEIAVEIMVIPVFAVDEEMFPCCNMIPAENHPFHPKG
jgi:hypothetical protein